MLLMGFEAIEQGVSVWNKRGEIQTRYRDKFLQWGWWNAGIDVVGILGQVGWGSEKHELVENTPAHCRRLE